MRIRIAMMEFKDGISGVIRGAPDGVAQIFRLGVSRSGGGELFCEVEGEVNTMHEEDALWESFTVEAGKVKKGEIAAKKHEIWRRKAWFLWSSPDNPPYMCFFMVHDEDMILQKPKPKR
ncbi:MAG TPA: hypothetical protein VEA59_06155 [Patescibacteria group bacterium]|nr:hypothetical protein [Patescibacteria group bacterium]